MLSHCKITSPVEEHPHCLLKWTKWTLKELIQQRGFAVHMLRDNFNARDSSVLAVEMKHAAVLSCCYTAMLMGTKGIWEMIAMYRSRTYNALYSGWLWAVDQVQLWIFTERDRLTQNNQPEKHTHFEHSSKETHILWHSQENTPTLNI